MIRGKYQGIIGGVVALGYAIGPIIGGALAQKVSWRVSTEHFFSIVLRILTSTFQVVLLDQHTDVFLCSLRRDICTSSETRRGQHQKV